MNHREPSEADEQTGMPLLAQSAVLNQIPMKWRVYENLDIRKRNARVEKWVREQVGVIIHGSKWRRYFPGGVQQF